MINPKPKQTRLDRLEALESDMLSVAIREIEDVCDMSNKTELRDREQVKELKELKANAAQTMLLMQRVGQYCQSKRGNFTGAGAVVLPEYVEKDAERQVINAIERFKGRK